MSINAPLTPTAMLLNCSIYTNLPGLTGPLLLT